MNKKKIESCRSIIATFPAPDGKFYGLSRAYLGIKNNASVGNAILALNDAHWLSGQPHYMQETSTPKQAEEIRQAYAIARMAQALEFHQKATHFFRVADELETEGKPDLAWIYKRSGYLNLRQALKHLKWCNELL